MAQFTENLVWSSDVSNTGVSNQSNTLTSDDNRNTMAISSDWIFELTNLSQTPTSIVSIQPKIEGRTNAQGGTWLFHHRILNGSNTQLYTEAQALSNDVDGTVLTLTKRTTSDGSNAWTENDINSLRIRVLNAGVLAGAIQGQIDHYYVEVVYNVDRLVKLDSGLVKLDSGLIKITS